MPRHPGRAGHDVKARGGDPPPNQRGIQCRGDPDRNVEPFLHQADDTVREIEADIQLGMRRHEACDDAGEVRVAELHRRGDAQRAGRPLHV
jgi:hypothetical protein